MHPLSFQLKRSHHSALATGRFLLKPIHPSLTPARFDLLYAVHENHYHSVTQAQLRNLLGLAPSTISKMLKRLEQLGLLLRKQNRFDRRTLDVTLTDLGRILLRIAMRAIMGSGILQLTFECLFSPIPKYENFLLTDNLISLLKRLAKHLGDFAQLRYPTDHPDD